MKGALRSEAPVPPLEAGDRLTRAEFARRYEASPHIHKAELVEGIAYVASPVSIKHSEPHALLTAWAVTWCAATPGARAFLEQTVGLDEDNEVQPDICVLLPGTRARFDEDGYLESAPDVAIEVSSSTTSYDLHQKKEVYRRHRAGIYIVWIARDQALRWFEWEGGHYIEREPEADGIYRSPRLLGAWLDPEAIAKSDTTRLLAALAEGLSAR